MRSEKEISLAIQIAKDVSYNDQDDIISCQIIDALRWVMEDEGYPGNETDFMYDPKKWAKS